jgi:sugar phosphate isomerase/epimerase
MLEEHGLKMAAIASPVFKCELDDESAHREHLEHLRDCIRIAKELDTTIIRLFTFWKRGPSGPVWERVKAQFRPVIQIAEDEGMVLGIENEHTTYCATAAETARFVTEMESPVVKIVWDPCNELHAEEGITPYPDGYELVGPLMVHLHVKDSKKDPATGEAHLTPLGDGVIDWAGQLRELLAKQYQGYASLETHWRPQALSEDMLNRPGGSSYSETGEYASDLCLRNLMQILAEARRELN